MTIPRPHSKLQRPPMESRAETIVLGLKTPQGAILAADTQEIYEQSHQVNRPTLVYKRDTNLCSIPIVLSVAGAGAGQWIDKLTTAMWDSVQDASNLDEACSQTETAITDHYRDSKDFVTLDPTADLIYAVGTTGGVRLFHAYGAVVNEVTSRAAGAGQAIADFLLRNFRDDMHITNAMSLAIYILTCAKRHADGCGGDTQVAPIHNNGFSTRRRPEQITAIERVLDFASRAGNMLVMIAGSTVYNPEHLKVAALALTESISFELSKFYEIDSIKKLLEAIEYFRPTFPGSQ